MALWTFVTQMIWVLSLLIVEYLSGWKAKVILMESIMKKL